MPVKRSYVSIPIRIADGGRLLPDLPKGTIGPANFDEKINFVTDIAEVRKRSGWDFPAPTDTWMGMLMESFGAPCDTICGVRRPNGTYAIVGCGGGLIKAYNYDVGWVTIGSGFSTEFDAGFRYWQICDIAGYAIFNNGRDLPAWWQIGDATVTPLYEFREAGYASAGGMVEYVDGVLMFHDILEINDADFEAVMNDPLPYKTIVGGELYPTTSTQAKSANFVVLPEDNGVLFEVTTGGSTIDVQLPSVLDVPAGWYFRVKKVDGGAGDVHILSISSGSDNISDEDGELVVLFANMDTLYETFDPPIANTTRITFRRVWSNIGDPRDFAVSVPGSVDSYVDPTELTLAWPMASLEVGDEILVIGAGTSGGNLQTTIVSIAGTSVIMADPALTTVADADVARPTDIDTIAGWDDIEDDGSAIVCQIPLKTQLMTFKASGHIWQTYYTGDLEEPFAKDRITKKPGVAPRFPRAVISIANDDNEEYILFPGAKHFYRLDLGSQAPKQEPLFMGAEKELFFSRIKGLGIYDVWAADNACTDEAIFAYLWDDYYSGYYGANRAIALKYAKKCESISEIDGFLFTCAATVQKPLAAFQCDEVESWFLMGDGNGAITLYGETNLEVLTLLRYGEAFEASLGGGLFSAGPASDNGSYVRRFSLDSSSPEASAATEVTIYGARSPNDPPVALETKTLTDPRFPGCMGLYYRKPFFKYRLVSVAETEFRISGFIWRIGVADTQNIDRLE